MIEVRKGTSIKSYENDFFRLLADGITKEFDNRGWDALLIGMPQSLLLEDLQIDCLLVTDNQIILIDFKSYGGDLILPDGESFDYGIWRINGEVAVRGGSSINPYRQLGKQRAKLVRLLDRTIHSFDKNTVFTLVCFHDQVNIIGEVPRRIVGFDIVDSTTILNKIVDIIDVKTEKHEYMKPKVRSLFSEKLFCAPLYKKSIELESKKITDLEVVVSSINDSSQSSLIKNSTDIGQESAYDIQIRDFLKSDDRAFIISGNSMSGKTGLIPRIREIAFELGYFDVPVFAYSNRMKKKMLKNYPEIEEVDSLYGEIFDFGKEEVDENYKRLFPVKIISEIEVGNINRGELFIIDDTQLITNSSFNSDNLQFGTGCLLDDLFTYLQLDKYPKRKVMFIGDSNRISYGSKVENVMKKECLKDYLYNKGISTDIQRLLMPAKTDGSEIIKVCNKIADYINTEKYNELIITSNNDVLIDSTDYNTIVETAFKDSNHNKILVGTNKKANEINTYIKKKFTQNDKSICVGDTIVFNSTIIAYSPKCSINEDTPFGNDDQPFNFNEPKRIDNGSFATIISVDSESTIILSEKIKEQTIELTFIPCQVKLSDSSIVQIFVFNNYLQGEKTDLGIEEDMAYQAHLNRLFQELLSNFKFEDSEEFKRMETNNKNSMAKTGKPYYNINESGQYRLETDRRKLPSEMKEYRKRIENILLKDSSTDYFKIYNAARVKYAWALTVNKAMAYTFKNVYFITDQGENTGRTNNSYYKWLYTGIATAEEKIELIKWKPISPFINVEFGMDSNVSLPKIKKHIYVFSNNNDEDKKLEFERFITKNLAQTNWRLRDISSKQFLEIVKLQKGETSLELFFDYNGKGEVITPRLKAGSKEEMNEIVEIIKSSNIDNNIIENSKDYKNMEKYFNELIILLNSRNINGKVNLSQKWSVYLEFSKKNQIVNIQCWYNSHGMISKFNCIEGSKELFNEIVEIIKETYSLNK